jgi:hypothetical protein
VLAVNEEGTGFDGIDDAGCFSMAIFGSQCVIAWSFREETVQLSEEEAVDCTNGLFGISTVTRSLPVLNADVCPFSFSCFFIVTVLLLMGLLAESSRCCDGLFNFTSSSSPEAPAFFVLVFFVSFIVAAAAVVVYFPVVVFPVTKATVVAGDFPVIVLLRAGTDVFLDLDNSAVSAAFPAVSLPSIGSFTSKLAALMLVVLQLSVFNRM